MMTTTHPLADDYLRRLERNAQVLPRRDRGELITEIRSHLEAGLRPDSTDADVLNLLDALGPPEDIVAAARPANRPATRRGLREVFALILLVTGLPPILGWLVGVGLLLWSPLWTGRQKLLGLLVWPGGYVMVFGLGTVVRSTSCSGLPVGTTSDPTGCVSAGPSAWWTVAGVIVAAAPIVVAAYLYRAAGRQTELGIAAS